MAAPDTGKNMVVDFGGTHYDDCLVSGDIADAATLVTSECGTSGVVQGATTFRNITGTFNWTILQTDVTMINAFDPGTEVTTFELHPGGDTATYIEITSTDLVIVSRNLSFPKNGLLAMTVTCHFNNLTVGTAA